MAKVFFSFVSAYLITLYMCSNSVDATPIVMNQDHLNYYEMPASCENDNYCFEKGDKYPDETIKKLLKNMRKLPVQDRTETSFNFRDGDESKNDIICPSNNTYEHSLIYYIYDTTDKVRVVVQSENFTQFYSVRWCQYPGRITTRETDAFVGNSQIVQDNQVECVNTIMDYDFFVLNDFNDKIEIVNAKEGIPVCCRCRYTKPTYTF